MNEELEQPSVSDDLIEIGEATLATIPMTTILKGDMPKIGIGVQKEITNIDKRIDKLAKQFVADELPKELSVPRPFVYEKLAERFSKPLTQLEEKDIMDKFPPNTMEGAISFKSTFDAAYNGLAEMVPYSEVATYLGPKNILPTSDKLLTFWLQYWVIDEPMVAFQLMQMGAIIPEQVESIKKFYPSLYNYMKVATLNALTERKIRESSFMNLPPRADRGLGVFKQMRIIEYGPNIHVVPPNEPKAASVAPPKIDKGLQTTGQRAEAL